MAELQLNKTIVNKGNELSGFCLSKRFFYRYLQHTSIEFSEYRAMGGNLFARAPPQLLVNLVQVSAVDQSLRHWLWKHTTP